MVSILGLEGRNTETQNVSTTQIFSELDWFTGERWYVLFLNGSIRRQQITNDQITHFVVLSFRLQGEK